MPWSSFFEAVMMICFGASWPAQIFKTVKVKNPAGKSFLFLVLILLGYLAGIAFKLASGRLDCVILLYIINTLMVGADLALSLHYLFKLKKAQTNP